jgi:hypothetical protein
MDYLNPSAIDPYAQRGAAPTGLTADPYQIYGQMQNRDMAQQLYGNSLAQSQLNLNEAQRKDLENQFNFEQMQNLRQNPEYISALMRQKMNDALAGGAESANKYLSAVQGAYDQVLPQTMQAVPMGTELTPQQQAQNDAQQQQLYGGARQQLQALGLGGNLPQTFDEAAPYIMAQANRYQYQPQYQEKAGIANIGANSRIAAAETRADAQAQIAQLRAQMEIENQKFRYENMPPQTFEQALLRGQITPQQYQQYSAMKPNFNPMLQGQITGAKTEAQKMAENQALIARMRDFGVQLSPQQEQGILGAGMGQQPQSNAPAVGTVMNGYRFKGGDPSQQSNWEKQ